MGTPVLADGGLFVLISTTPPDGGVAVSASVTPQATFSARVDSTAQNLARAHLYDVYLQREIPLAGTTMPAADTLRLSAIGGLPRGSTIEFRIDGTLTSGPATFAGESVFFTTTSGRWLYPEAPLPTTGTDGLAVASDATELIHVGWVSGDTVTISEGRPGGGTILNSGHSTLAPQLALDAAGDGKAVAAWVEGTTSRDVRASVFTGQWSSSVPLETFSDQAADPQVAVDPTGNARVVWEQTIDGGVSIASACLVGGAWQPQEQLTTLPRAASPRIGSDDLGRAVLAWREAGAVKVRTGSLTGLLGSEVLLAPAGSADTHVLATNTVGGAVVAWTGTTGLFVSTWDGSQWQTHNLTATAFDLSIGLDDRGVATLVWWDATDNWVVRGSGTTWSTPARLNVLGRAPRPARVAVSGPLAIALWIEQSTSSPGTYRTVSSTFALGSWSAPVNVAGSRANFPMNITLGPRGEGLAVWAEEPTSGSPRFTFINWD